MYKYILVFGVGISLANQYGSRGILQFHYKEGSISVLKIVIKYSSYMTEPKTLGS